MLVSPFLGPGGLVPMFWLAHWAPLVAADRQVPLGLLLGIQVKRRMAPAMLEVICPVTSVEMGNQQHVVLDYPLVNSLPWKPRPIFNR
jgi:hypothetical protein